MAKFAMVLAALCFLFALSRASELEGYDVSTVDPGTQLPVGDDLMEIPYVESAKADQIQSDRESADSKVPESAEELTTITFRPGDHKFEGLRPISFRFPFRHRKPCRHGRHPIKPMDLPFGNDMILSGDKKGSRDLEGQRPTRWVRFHHQGKPKFGDGSEMMEMVSETTDRLERSHHHHHRFEDEEEEREGHYHHHHHRRHHHRRHHEEEEAGFLGKIRKFLINGF